MADRAIRRGERGSRRSVHRRCGAAPQCQVALRVSTTGRRDLQSVVVIDVALVAGHVGVSIGQQKTGGAVIEVRRSPIDRRVAGRASRNRETSWSHRMRRIICRIPGRQMAL